MKRWAIRWLGQWAPMEERETELVAESIGFAVIAFETHMRANISPDVWHAGDLLDAAHIRGNCEPSQAEWLLKFRRPPRRPCWQILSVTLIEWPGMWLSTGKETWLGESYE